MGRGYENFAIHVGERLPSDFGSKDIEDLASFLASKIALLLAGFLAKKDTPLTVQQTKN
jgi:hypothetical protein